MAKKEEVIDKQQAVHHGKAFEQLMALPAYIELSDKYAQLVREYYQLKQDSDFEGVMRDPLQMQYLIDCERRVKYQLEIFDYIKHVVKLGKDCEKELNAATAVSK